MTTLPVLARPLAGAALLAAALATTGHARAQQPSAPIRFVQATDGAAARGARPPTRRIVLANRHLATVRQVHLSPTTEADWGPDRLNAAMLAVDEDTTVEMQGGCQADLRIVFAEGAAEERRAIDICATTRVVLRPGWVLAERLDEEEPVMAEPAMAAPGALRLRNAGPLPIVELYAGPPGGPRGEDRLGDDILPVGMTTELEAADPDACAADLVALFRDGREVISRGVDLCAGEEIEIR